MSEEIITSESELLSYLLNKFNNLSRNSVKNLLLKKQIVVNDRIVTKHNYLLKKGDKISFCGKKDTFGLKIIYEDELFIVINKPHNLLTVATDKEKEKTAYVQVSNYLKQDNPKNKAYVLHRLDKETSGVLVFCKKEKVKDELQEDWNNVVTKREYIAIIEGALAKKEGTIKSYLKENKFKQVYSTNARDGKLAITDYKVIRENSKYSLVNINLKTGRKNQIRVHFQGLGHPLIGDKKYSSSLDPLHRLCLHASKIAFAYQNKEYIFQASEPNEFKKII